MKTHTLKISTISILCVLCAGLTTNAMAAGTVRSLGGAGTIDGTSAAATATRSVTPTRAGSLRVTPSASRLITSNNSSASSSGASAARLSIGKYLGTAATTSTTESSGSGSSSGAGSASSNVGQLEDRIESLEELVGSADATASNDTLAGRVAALEDKEIHGSADGIVGVAADGTVSINVDALIDELEDQGAISSSRETEIQYTAGHDLQWRYTSGDDTEWHTLLNTSALEGDWATSDELDAAILGLANTYLTKAEAATTYQPKGSYATTEQLATKADKSDTYTKSEVDTAISTGVGGVDLSGYETSAHASATYQPKGDYLTEHQSLAGLATTDAIADMETKTHAAATYQPKGDYLTEHQDISGKADKATTYTKTEVDTALGSKANAADVYTKSETYSKSEVDTVIDGISGDAGSIATQINTALADYTPTSGLAAVATSGDYADLSNKPSIPTKTSDLTNDSGYLTAHQDISGKQDTLTAAQLAAVNSGIDETKVGQIATNKADIAAIHGAAQLMEERITLKANQNYVETELGTLSNAVASKQAALDADQLAAVNSGVTSTTVAQVAANTSSLALQNDALALKANAADVYTKTQADTLLAGKQDALSFDTTPTQNSTNPVTSGGIYTAISSMSGDVESIGEQIDTKLADYTTTATLESTYATKSALDLKADKSGVYPKAIDIPGSGQYVLGFVDGVQMYIPVVDADGNSGSPIVAQATE